MALPLELERRDEPGQAPADHDHALRRLVARLEAAARRRQNVRGDRFARQRRRVAGDVRIVARHRRDSYHTKARAERPDAAIPR